YYTAMLLSTTIPPTTHFYPLSLHDALPISLGQPHHKEVGRHHVPIEGIHRRGADFHEHAVVGEHRLLDLSEVQHLGWSVSILHEGLHRPLAMGRGGGHDVPSRPPDSPRGKNLSGGLRAWPRWTGNLAAPRNPKGGRW